MSEIQVKPCPFCGSILVDTIAEQDMNKYYGEAVCRECSATVYAGMRRSETEAKMAAIDKWNRRVTTERSEL